MDIYYKVTPLVDHPGETPPVDTSDLPPRVALANLYSQTCSPSAVLDWLQANSGRRIEANSELWPTLSAFEDQSDTFRTQVHEAREALDQANKMIVALRDQLSTVTMLSKQRLADGAELLEERDEARAALEKFKADHAKAHDEFVQTRQELDKIKEGPSNVTPVSILEQALAIVNGARQKDYGSPEDCFGTIAQFWTTYLLARGKVIHEILPREVCQMMVLLKTARDAAHFKEDNLVDGAGYLECAARVA